MERLLLISLIALYSCNSPTAKTVFKKDLVSQEIRQMLIDYHDAINEKGLLAEFNYLDSSSEFFWVPPGYRSALSFDSVSTILIQNSRALKSVKFEWESLIVHPINNDIGTYNGVVKGNFTDTSGLSSKMRIIESGTIIKRDDGWKLLSGQSALLNTEDDSI